MKLRFQTSCQFRSSKASFQTSYQFRSSNASIPVTSSQFRFGVYMSAIQNTKLIIRNSPLRISRTERVLHPTLVMATPSLFERQLMTDASGQRRRKERYSRLEGKKDEHWKYTPLVKAALIGDWETANIFFEQYPNAIKDPITNESETVLHMATGTGPLAINFVAELLSLEQMTPQALAHRDIQGNTPLHLAAWVANTDAAVLLVQRNPGLLSVREKGGWLPVHYAAINAKKETLCYLLEVTLMDDASMDVLFFSCGIDQPSGPELLIHVITSGFYDVALDLVHRYPQLAISHAPNDDDCGLGALARKVDAFRSGTQLNFWERIIYAYVPVKLENYARYKGRVEIEDPVNSSQPLVQKYHWSRFLGKIFSIFVPHYKKIQEKKQMHHQALQLVRYLIQEMTTSYELNAYDSPISDAIVKAAELGIHEVVEEIVELVPKLVWARDSKNLSIFQVAVIQRHENIFNLIYQMTDHKHSVTTDIDEFGNNILHLAGRLAPPHKLNLVPGAALQMQRELQWFKEVKHFVRPSHIERQNNAKETPAMVFTREHKELVVAGGKWVKNTASSCTISAALIVTMVFAAILIVPGGNDSKGLPIFSKEIPFLIFLISDALSLFTSTTSLLLFLSILTSRYSEGDFLHVLPKRLMLGLVTLFFSITTMLVAFSFSLYFVLGHKKAWILFPVVAVACFPITSFVSLQFPLLVDLISSMYGSGIFGKQSDRQFY